MSAVENQKHPEKVEGKLAYLRANYPDGKGGVQKKRERYKEPSQLPTWVKDAISMHEIDGKTWSQIAKAKGKAIRTIHQWMTTPAARKLRDSLRDVVGDPVGTAKLMAKMDAAWVYRESVQLYRTCIESGDRSEAGRLLRHFADLNSTKVTTQNNTPAIVQINLQGATFTTEMPQGSSEAKVVEAEVVDG